MAAEYDSDPNFMGAKRYIETSNLVLGLSTPASRVAQQPHETPKYSSNQIISPRHPEESENFSPSPTSNLAEGEIMKGLNADDALLPSRRHLIKEISGLVDHSENLILSLAALRVLAQISHLHQFEPDPTLASVAPNRLFSILQEESGCLERIKNNFRRRLEREEVENVQFLADGKNYPHLISTWLLLNARGDEIERILTPDFTDAFGLTNYIRLFIVNFFATNVSKRSFNLAHFILGFSQDSKEPICESGCLSLLIDMLMYGLGHASVEAPVIFIEHPALGLKLLSFLKALLLAPNQFSKPALTYLRHDRQLFSQFASKINTRLLQVAFSTEKGYALSTEFESIKSSDFHFNVFELLQKAELFEILAMDVHEAFSNGHEGLYLEQLLEYLVITSNGRQDGPLGEPRAILFLSAIDNVTEDAYIKRLRSQSDGGEFGAALVCEFEEACSSYIVSLSTLIGELLTVFHSEGSSFADFAIKEREQFVEALQAWIWKFMQKLTLSAAAIEALIQLNVLIGDSSKQLQSRDSLEAQISVLLRPEINVTTRCYIYTVLMNQEAVAIGQQLPEDRFLRLVELVTRDASNTAFGAVNDSLVTVALAALEFLNRARPSLLLEALLANSNSTGSSLSYIIPTAINSTAPFISSLLGSLTVDDGLACSLILAQSQSKSVSEEDLSIFLKWRAKWSLLLNLVLKEPGDENDSLEAASSFAHRFIDGGFLESVLFKFKCLSLNVAYRISDSSHLVLLTIHPVLKFLCALGMASDRRTAISSRLLSHFRSSDALDALTVIASVVVGSESAAASQAAVIHCILVLVNGVIDEAASSISSASLEDMSAKLISFRQAILNQINQKSRWIHRISRISSGSLTPFVEEDQIGHRLQTEIQVLEESVHFLSREGTSLSEIFSSNLTAETMEEKGLTSLSLGTLIFLLKTCIAKLREGQERADLLEYYAKNLDNRSPSDLEALWPSDDHRRSGGEAVKTRIDRIYRDIIDLQSHLVQLIEKTCFLLLKTLRLKLNCIIGGGPGSTSYVDSRSPQVQAARSLKTDASIILLPVLDSYQKSVRLVESSANNSLYMNALVQDFFSLLSSNNHQGGGVFEI